MQAYEPRIADPVLEPRRWREMDELGGRGALCMNEAEVGTLWFECIGGLLNYDGLQVDPIPFDVKLLPELS